MLHVFLLQSLTRWDVFSRRTTTNPAHNYNPRQYRHNTPHSPILPLCPVSGVLTRHARWVVSLNMLVENFGKDPKRFRSVGKGVSRY